MIAQTVDYVIIVCLAIAFIRGVQLGIGKSLLQPAFFVLSLLGGFIYYRITGDLFKSLAILVFFPMAVKLLIFIAVKIFKSSPSSDDTLTLASRMAGGSVSSAWAGFQIILMLVLLVMVPFQWKWLQKLQISLEQSQSYRSGEHLMALTFGTENVKIKNITEVLESPSAAQEITRYNEYKEIMADEKVKALLDDEESRKNLKNKNVMKLLADEKFQNILKDEKLLRKFIEIGKKLSLPGNPPEEKQ